MTTIMVKSIRFGKIVKQTGRNKRAGWKSASRVAKTSEKFKQACSSIKDFSVGVFVCTY